MHPLPKPSPCVHGEGVAVSSTRDCRGWRTSHSMSQHKRVGAFAAIESVVFVALNRVVSTVAVKVVDEMAAENVVVAGAAGGVHPAGECGIQADAGNEIIARA